MHKFITYGDDKFKQSKERIAAEALAFGFEVNVYSPNDLSKDFMAHVGPVFASKGGHWIWKTYILKDIMDKSSYCDVITYCDAGCTVNINGHKRYNEYLQMLIESPTPILAFKLQQQNKTYQWTKTDVLDYFNITPDNKIYESIQLIGGIIMMIKTPFTEYLINTYYNIAITRPDLFIDAQAQPPHKGFIEHRHDQSIFSILRYLHGCVIVDDKTFPANYYDLQNEPFLATRLRQ